METTLNGLISLSAAKHAKAVKNVAAAHVTILSLYIKEKTARTWAEL